MNHLWRSTLRPWIVVAMVAIFILALRILWPFLTPIALALLLTYILIPIVNRIQEQTQWNRTRATVFVYLVLLILIILTPILVFPVISMQVTQFQKIAEDAIREVSRFVTEVEPGVETITILGQQIDVSQLYSQFASQINSQVSTLVQGAANLGVTLAFGFATTFLSTLVWLLFILVISFYIVYDSPNVSRYLWGIIPREARLEVYYLTRRIGYTWNAFLRGQLMLSTVIFVATSAVLLVLGVPQALFLGIIAGLLNFIPNLGPILSAIPAVTIALIQGSTYLEMSNWVFAIVLMIAYMVIQQLESQVLVPRIIGGSVNLHPAVILIGALVGLSTVGVLGIFLAAPVLASLRVIGGYAYRKLLDPDFTPSSVILPPEIASIPDPRERPLFSVKILTEQDDLPAWRRALMWLKGRQQQPEEDTHDAQP